MNKKELALEVIERLKNEYPDADCTLEYDQAWKLLVSVRLAAQCTDARVNVVVKGLFEKYPTVEALAAADVADIEEIVRPCGLGKSKARDISKCMKVLRDEYNGKIPTDFKSILSLPGVGRKSANLIMGDVFGKPAIVTDTHCIRLVNRIGLVDGIKDPKKVEMALWEIIPPEEGSDFCHRLVWHGRDVCTARTKPHCDHGQSVFSHTQHALPYRSMIFSQSGIWPPWSSTNRSMPSSTRSHLSNSFSFSLAALPATVVFGADGLFSV